MNYIEVECIVNPIQPWTEIIISELGELGFESFQETENGCLAYIQESDFQDSYLTDIQNLSTKETFSLELRHTIIEDQNWNSVWESSFDKIEVDGWCCIRAPFHEKGNALVDIIIEPKMSFGTGHHQTTFMMIQMMKNLKWQDSKVLDMGTGTGVLAILANRLGANNIVAIDNEEWAYNNCVENIALNNSELIQVKLGEEEQIGTELFDVVLANINRNALTKLLKQFYDSMNKTGVLLLSGFLKSDENHMKNEIESSGFKVIEILEKENWLGICCQKI